MPNLLTLALTETTRSEYEVVAWDLDNDQWVLLPNLPLATATKDGMPIWDLFQVTYSEIIRNFRESRINVYNIISTPKPVRKILGSERLDWLIRLSQNQTVDAPIYNNNYVTLVKPDNIQDIIMIKKQIDNPVYSRPFYWESRIEFEQNYQVWRPASGKVGVACKDLRWKTYWHEIVCRRPRHFLESREKWLKILKSNQTFFLVEYYNLHRYYVIAGVHSLPV